MSKRINSYQAVAAFVRGFFEAYARGIIDATIEGNDFSKKNDPKQIKQMMLEHYGMPSRTIRSAVSPLVLMIVFLLLL